MPNRPVYPIATVFERIAYAVLAVATGLGLLVAIVTAFQTQLPESLAGRVVVSRVTCEREAAPSDACRAAGLATDHNNVVAAR